MRLGDIKGFSWRLKGGSNKGAEMGPPATTAMPGPSDPAVEGDGWPVGVELSDSQLDHVNGGWSAYKED
jgi:hypothetical protein